MPIREDFENELREALTRQLEHLPKGELRSRIEDILKKPSEFTAFASRLAGKSSFQSAAEELERMATEEPNAPQTEVKVQGLGGGRLVWTFSPKDPPPKPQDTWKEEEQQRDSAGPRQGF